MRPLVWCVARKTHCGAGHRFLWPAQPAGAGCGAGHRFLWPAQPAGDQKRSPAPQAIVFCGLRSRQASKSDRLPHEHKAQDLRRTTLVWLCAAVSLGAQHWVNPDVEAHRIDLRELGYPEVNQIPANSSAITSLLAAPGGKIYGGTSGAEAYLFVYDPAINKVRHLGRVKGEQGIHHSLVADARGSLYLGAGINVLRPLELTRKIANARDSISDALWADVKKPYQSYAGGRLYRYDPAAGDRQVPMPEDACPLEDLGVAVPGNGIYALAINPRAETIYGISYPDGRLFEYRIAQKQFRDLGELDRRVVFHGPERDWRSLPRALVVDTSGRVYTSGEDGLLVYFDPGQEKILSTGLKVPGEYYPVQAYTGHPVAECFVKDAKGLIYGGSSDGFLFSFDPAARRLVNLGKPRVSRRLRALTLGRDGRLYMVAGERFEPCRLFSFDPMGGGFRDLGIVARSPHYSWRGYQFNSMTSGADGTIYLGESERRSHLFFYLPGERGRQ